MSADTTTQNAPSLSQVSSQATTLSSTLGAALDAAIQDDVTPGGVCAVAVGQNAPTVVARGRLSRVPTQDHVVTDETVYDLASLTKVLSTTVLCAEAIAAGKLSLTDPVHPGWPGVTVAHVLKHSAGLPAWRPFFEDVKAGHIPGTWAARDALVTAVRDVVPEATPGTRTVYSDVGFIALGALLEDVLCAPIDVLFGAVSAFLRGRPGPAALGDVQYVPLMTAGYHSAMPNVAPTEECVWRGRFVQGQVHDDNAFVMGGIAPHAGLFATAPAVCRAGQAILAALHGTPPHEGRFTGLSTVLRTFAAMPDDQNARPLGFDRASEGGTTGGVFGPRTVGHLGFTGTSLWIDPGAADGQGLTVVLLTNRVCPVRDGPSVTPLRRAICAAAMRALDPRG